MEMGKFASALKMFGGKSKGSGNNYAKFANAMKKKFGSKKPEGTEERIIVGEESDEKENLFEQKDTPKTKIAMPQNNFEIKPISNEDEEKQLTQRRRNRFSKFMS